MVHFKLGDDGLWHNKRADAEIIERERRGESRRRQTEAARHARIESVSVTDIVTESVTDIVTESVTDIVTESVTGVQPQPQPQVQPEPQPQPKKTGGASESRPARICDDAWIAELEKDQTYAGLNIRTELGKMNRWCDTNRAQPSRRRFINWLNRAEKPMAANHAHRYVPNI